MMDRDELRKLAEAASQGEWVAEGGFQGDDIAVWLRYEGVIATVHHEDMGKKFPARANAAYIAAVSPEVVLALLDRIEKLEKGFADLANMTPYRITGEALTPTQLRELIEQIARQAETILLEKNKCAPSQD